MRADHVMFVDLVRDAQQVEFLTDLCDCAEFRACEDLARRVHRRTRDDRAQRIGCARFQFETARPQTLFVELQRVAVEREHLGAGVELFEDAPVIRIVRLEDERRLGGEISVGDGVEAAGRARRDDQFERLRVRVDFDAVDEPDLGRDGVAQLRRALGGTVVVLAGADHFVRRPSQRLVNRQLRLPLHQIAAWRHEPRDLTYVGFHSRRHLRFHFPAAPRFRQGTPASIQ